MRTYFVPEGTVGSVNRGAEKYPIVEGVVELPTDLAIELGWTPVPLQAAAQGATKKPAAIPFGDSSVALMPADQAKAFIAEASAEDLDRAEASELANAKNPGGRKGVLAAIVDRRKALQAAAQGDNQ